MSIYVNAHNQT